MPIRFLPSVKGRDAGCYAVKALWCLLPALFFSAGLWAAEAGSGKGKEGLSEGDCIKCHEREASDLQEAGGEHLTGAGCVSCHPGHPPGALEVFLPCGSCHQGSVHVDRQGPCLPCHRNPHRPREISLAKEFSAACLDCHPSVGEEFAAAPSIHARFACVSCHEAHPETFPCTECHREHTPGVTQKCETCHPPHRPIDIRIGGDSAAPVCLACHGETGQKLESGGSAHRGVGCAGCHAGRHGTIPACRQCHPHPHPEQILKKFAGCAPCHGDAHTLRPQEPEKRGKR